MPAGTATSTIEAMAVMAGWSDGRLLLTALHELPSYAQAEVNELLAKRNIGPISELNAATAEGHFDELWTTLLNKLTFWRDDMMQRLYDEVCVQHNYCGNRNSQDFSFWSELLAVIAGVLGDLGAVALSLLLLRRLLDQLCGCDAAPA